MNTIKRIVTSVCLGTIITFQSIYSFAQPITQDDVLYEETKSEIVTSGLEYEIKSKLTKDGWVDLHVLKMDLNNEYINLDILRSMDQWGIKDTITNFANQEPSVVAGINGSFFDMSKNPTDIIGSEYNQDYASIKNNYNMVDKGAASIIQTNAGELLIDFFGANIQVHNGEGRELFISGINTMNSFENPVIFNQESMKDTKDIDEIASLYKIVVEENEVVDVETPNESVEIPENGYVIVIHENIAKYHLDYFSVGEQVSLIIQNSLDREDIQLALSGGGKILEDGQLASTGMIVEPNKRHPRTAIGITEDENYLIAMVVDGRGSSIGATHEELGEYLKEYNVSDAMHFDGGGSSTLVSRELGDLEVQVANTPSGGAQRTVINGLGFVTTAPESALHEIKIIPSTSRVYVGMPITFEIKGYDQYYNPIIIDENKVFWSHQGVTGTWKDDAFIPTSSGIATLSCYYDGQVASIDIISVDSYIDLEVEPKVLQLELGKTGSFKVIGTDEEGYKAQVSLSNITYEVQVPSIVNVKDGTFVGKEEGLTKVKFKIDDRELSAYVAVGYDKSLLNSFEDLTVDSISYPDTVTGETKVTNQVVNTGSQSLQLDYQFAQSTQTQAMYSILEDVVIGDQVDRLGLYIYGDKNNFMVKGKIIDAQGVNHNITFAPEVNWVGWKYVEANIPSNVAYPIQLERIYIAALSTMSKVSGTVYLDDLTKVQVYDEATLDFDTEELIDDPLMSKLSNPSGTVISVFGSTSGRNRLLDDVILKKVYDEMNNSDLAVFTGSTDISKNQLDTEYIQWKDLYQINDYKDYRIIHLATSKGGLLSTDADQWVNLEKDLKDTVQNNIIFIANYNPNDFDDQREGELLHSIIKDYQQISGKNIFYITANGYDFNVDFREGIRYIDLNGLWYQISEDNKLNLDKTFYMINFYINGNDLKYHVKDLYPKVQIGN